MNMVEKINDRIGSWEMEGEKSYLMPIILICVGIYYLCVDKK